MKVEHNISRLKHLLRMYRLSVEEFLQLISRGLKKPITAEDVFSDEIRIQYLKRIDKLFNKGLHYYLNPKAPEKSKEASVFFRKKSFATELLNIGAVKIVNQFEELKLSLSSIAKLSELNFKRKISKYSINQDSQQVANYIRNKIYPPFLSNRREFLKSLISNFAEYNIMVFEFIETWNKKEKTNIDGFYLKPNMIVIKRHQTFSREIFTLAHEFGHYLLDEEEIEEIDYQIIADRGLTKVERWCNDFAYYFLIGNFSKKIDSLEPASAKNDYHFDIIEGISAETHLRKLALFTRLLYTGKISKSDYRNVKNELDEIYRRQQKEKERKKQLLNELGKKQGGSAAKPISSPLFISVIQTAFYEGLINEYEVCKKLKIKPENLNNYI